MKKIVFYNTGVGTLLQHDDKMLEKIRDVLRTFKKNQEDTALLWRPHPLIQATLKSMRPWLWQKYNEIVDQYRAEGWGIYDDTSDMDRAIILSDAYYGDSSSVVPLYQKTGKIAMFQNVALLSEPAVEMLDLAERNRYISFRCFHLIEDDIILSNIRGNGLFVLDSRDFHIKKLEHFIHMPLGAEFYHSCSCVCGQTIYFCPSHGSRGIHKYNVTTGEQGYIETGSLTFRAAYSQDDGIILMPMGYGAEEIWKLDPKTDKLSPIKWRGFQEGEAPHSITCGQMRDSKVWMVPMGTPYLFIVDTVTGETQRTVIGNSAFPLHLCAYDGEHFWFTLLDDEPIIRWAAESGEIRYYTPLHHDLKERIVFGNDMKFFYKCIMPYEGRVFIIDGSGIFSVDAESGEAAQLALLPKKTIKSAMNNWSVISWICGRKIVVSCYPTNLVAVIDADTLKVEFHDTTIRNSPEFEGYVQTLCDKKIEEALENKILSESQVPDLRKLDDLFTLVRYCRKGENLAREDAGVGEDIYRHVLSEG